MGTLYVIDHESQHVLKFSFSFLRKERLLLAEFSKGYP